MRLLTGLSLSWENAVRNLPGQGNCWATLLVTDFIFLSYVSFAQARNELTRNEHGAALSLRQVSNKIGYQKAFFPLSDETNTLRLWFCILRENCVSFRKTQGIGNFSDLMIKASALNTVWSVCPYAVGQNVIDNLAEHSVILASADIYIYKYIFLVNHKIYWKTPDSFKYTPNETDIFCIPPVAQTWEPAYSAWCSMLVVFLHFWRIETWRMSAEVNSNEQVKPFLFSLNIRPSDGYG